MSRQPEKKGVRLADGRQLTVDCWPGRGAPLVLLHGMLDSGAGWKKLAQATQRPCYAFDLPGFGDSDCPTRNRISAYAEDVREALLELDVHGFTLVGHSLGGGVAAALAELIPGDVIALVLMAPVGFGRIYMSELMQLPLVRGLVRHSLPLALLNPFTSHGVYMAVVGNGHAPDPELSARLRQNAYRCAPGVACATAAIAAGGLSPRALFRRHVNYGGPVFALWGDHDRLVPLAHRSGVSAAFAQAKVTVWKNMGHHAQHERPALLAEFIETACSDTAKPGLKRQALSASDLPAAA